MRIRIQAWGILLCMLTITHTHAQSKTDTAGFSVSVFNEQDEALAGAIVEIQLGVDNTLVKSAVTNKKGLSVFYMPVTTGLFANISFIGYQPVKIPILQKNITDKYLRIVLTQAAKELANVTVNSRKPFLQQAQGKIIVNVDASVTNAGTTILEVMEKLPGVIVDKNGGISLQGKAGVLVLIDDKPTYVSGSDLNNLLSGMSSAQVDQIELITSPSAKYDANGNAGIINIKTKKNKQVGFNGILSTSFTQGRYPKSNNSLVLNYRNGRFNAFLTYSGNYNKGFTDIYALRKYYNPSRALVATLDQPTIFISQNLGHTLKTGFDFYAGPTTTLGLAFTGIWVNRETTGDAAAHWINTRGGIDSTIQTSSNSTNHFNNVGVNVNGKHSIGKLQEISFDVDLLKYSINNRQKFNSFFASGSQQAEGSRGDLPADIDIFSAKADHRFQISNYSKLESGYKISNIQTDNVAAYDYFDGTQWKEDLGKSNHFLYKEAIQAIYSSIDYKKAKLSYQLGLRFENTNYDAHQLGNSARNDSAFSNNYSGFFPSGFLSYEADSSNIFTVSAGRRIDRPPFQRLNPFVLIINKYTYERGNPFFKPQYSWNLELSHQFKRFLTTTLSYSIIKDYFSQLFLAEGTDILVYTNGNVGKMVNLGLSVAVQLSPAKWWSLNCQTIFNYKQFSGYQNVNYQSNISQLNTSINNQFRLDKNYTAEISGFYTGKARNDIQERLLPTGQLSIGIARPVLQKKGTLKLSMRDIFFTQVMEGNTDFPNADEYFILRRDTRVINIAFTWRLGKPLKTQHRSTGGAKDEIDRVNGG